MAVIRLQMNDETASRTAPLLCDPPEEAAATRGSSPRNYFYGNGEEQSRLLSGCDNSSGRCRIFY